MRKVTFKLNERIVLSPTEFMISIKYLPLLIVLLYLIDVLIGKGTPQLFYRDTALYLGAIFTGAFLFPPLLPLLPTRYFFIKGWILGIIYIFSINLIFPGTIPVFSFHLFIIPPLISFLAYNFTGSTTFTSLSGVEKEFKFAIPAYAGSVFAGLAIMIFTIVQGKS